MVATVYRSFAEQALHYFDRPHSGLPSGSIESPAAWHGSVMREDTARWTATLSPSELGEIEDAVASVRSAGLGMGAIRRQDFRLPTLSGRIAAWRKAIAEGPGFLLVRGLPVQHWGEDASALAYWGLGLHLGIPGAQNAQNELLGHVVDYGEEATNPLVRRYRTTGNIDFHCDAADAVGLLCLQAAREGGQSRIASSVAIYNEVVRRRPDLARRLFEPFLLDRRGEHRAGEPGYVEVPAARFAAGRLRTFYHSEYFRSASRFAVGGRLDERTGELLDLYDAIAGDPEFHLDMWLEPGDVQFISNHTIVHARTEYRDHSEPDRKRHLLRLWLSFDDDLAASPVPTETAGRGSALLRTA
jgi:hypothetical protein